MAKKKSLENQAAEIKRKIEKKEEEEFNKKELPILKKTYKGK